MTALSIVGYEAVVVQACALESPVNPLRQLQLESGQSGNGVNLSLRWKTEDMCSLTGSLCVSLSQGLMQCCPIRPFLSEIIPGFSSSLLLIISLSHTHTILHWAWLFLKFDVSEALQCAETKSMVCPHKDRVKNI